MGECRPSTSNAPPTRRSRSLSTFTIAGSVTSIVDTPEEAAALDRPPLLIRRPLEAFLDEHGLGSGDLQAEPVGDGHSNVTYVIRRDGGEWVLRRPPRPPLPPSAHDVLREAFLLRALEGTDVRVPKVLATCDDDGACSARRST